MARSTERIGRWIGEREERFLRANGGCFACVEFSNHQQIAVTNRTFDRYPHAGAFGDELRHVRCFGRRRRGDGSGDTGRRLGLRHRA